MTEPQLRELPARPSLAEALEIYLTDPRAEPDCSTWQTEIAYGVA